MHTYGLFKVILYISFIKRYGASQSTAIFLFTCISRWLLRAHCPRVSTVLAHNCHVHIPFRKHTTCSFFADSVLELIYFIAWLPIQLFSFWKECYFYLDSCPQIYLRFDKKLGYLNLYSSPLKARSNTRIPSIDLVTPVVGDTYTWLYFYWNGK